MVAIGYSDAMWKKNKVSRHLVSGDVAGGVDEGGKSSASYYSHGVVAGYSDRFKSSMASSALGCWSLRACAQRHPGCHQQHQTGSGSGAATAHVSGT
jgi:hypothetical protein